MTNERNLAGKTRELQDVGTKQGFNLQTKEGIQEMNWSKKKPEECFQAHDATTRGVLQVLLYLCNKQHA